MGGSPPEPALPFSMVAAPSLSIARCPVQARGKRGGGCQLFLSQNTHARMGGPTWKAGDLICSAYCCKAAAGLEVYNAVKECARKATKRQKLGSNTPVAVQSHPPQLQPPPPLPPPGQLSDVLPRPFLMKTAGSGIGYNSTLRLLESLAKELKVNIKGYTMQAALNAVYAAAGFVVPEVPLSIRFAVTHQRAHALADKLGIDDPSNLLPEENKLAAPLAKLPLPRLHASSHAKA